MRARRKHKDGRVPSEHDVAHCKEHHEEQEVPKLVYDFTEGNKDLKDLLGGKGANLAEMTNIGLPVPPGFTITTEACRYYLDLDEGEIASAMRVSRGTVKSTTSRALAALGRILEDQS